MLVLGVADSTLNFPMFPSGFTLLTGSGLEEDDLLKAYELFRRAVSGRHPLIFQELTSP